MNGGDWDTTITVDGDMVLKVHDAFLTAPPIQVAQAAGYRRWCGPVTDLSWIVRQS